MLKNIDINSCYINTDEIAGFFMLKASELRITLKSGVCYPIVWESGILAFASFLHSKLGQWVQFDLAPKE